MSSITTRTAAAAAVGVALGFGAVLAQSATAAAAPTDGAAPQAPYTVQVRDRIGCANAWPMVACDAPDEDVPEQVELYEPGTTLTEPGGVELFGSSSAPYHAANYPLEPDDGVISHSLDPDMPWM
ncbi:MULTISPECIES: hypothetical protein [Rhodococcus]|uniref:Uncharacterized protein n=2 Tax=Rhodococcus TaxID=1827 RepID=X0PZE6_RHOWR|nr:MULTISPECIES: hypothetical protein [Rhodococcus]AII03362.1 hypothetical protein EP51_01375 [Rhodococcus opacus]GAF49034.1 hypothetical protein RW1_065_00400 [Rhodococcus wratislaviensis NBRC 100605]